MDAGLQGQWQMTILLTATAVSCTSHTGSHEKPSDTCTRGETLSLANLHPLLWAVSMSALCLRGRHYFCFQNHSQYKYPWKESLGQRPSSVPLLARLQKCEQSMENCIPTPYNYVSEIVEEASHLRHKKIKTLFLWWCVWAGRGWG